MKISLNKIRYASEHYQVPDLVPDSVDELVKKIGAQLGAVEEVIDYGGKFEGVIIVKVVSCEKHPNAEKLNICTIDDGGITPDVNRGEDGHIQVVCGAPNVRAGMLAAWLPPGATVPSTRDKDPFVLEARELRGVVSNGMLASPKELGIGDSHEGLLVVDREVEPGTSFAKAYRAEGEMIIDIENKMFTHRPDCFGIMGVTREIAGIQQKPFKSPDWYVPNPELPNIEADELKLEIKNELPELTPRFTAITMSDVEVKPSPIWLQIFLSEVGIRPINNIVDLTNFWMLETGQPLHAYDYDKVKALSGDDGLTIVVRQPKQDEKIKLLNGKEIEPRAEAIMIATDKQLIGIGGVMGGSETEVDEGTKNIILECANFDMYSIRRTSMTHGLFTDAVTRFTKGQSPLQVLPVLTRIVEQIRQEAGGKVAGPVIDSNHVDDFAMQSGALHPPVTLTKEFINERLGLDLNDEQIIKLLENVEFQVHTVDGAISVTAPFWRTDIELPEDIVEEVGRLYGYDHLPLKLPKRDLTPAPKDPLLELKSEVRDALSQACANEVLTYGFVHGDLIDRVGQDKSQAFQISNALSPDLQYYRLSLTPSLLEKIHPNIKAGYDEFALFELGKAHILGKQENDLPVEFDRLSLIVANKNKNATASYYQARKYLMTILDKLNLAGRVRFETLGENEPDIATVYYAPGRSATVYIDDRVAGRIGEYKASVRKALKLPATCAGFELGLALLLTDRQDKAYVALPRFPKVTQDITLRVSTNLAYQELFNFVWQELGKIQPKNTFPTLSPRDIFQREGDLGHKQVTFRLEIASYDRTLTDPEVNKLLDSVAAAAKTKYGAERI